ncbi:Metacaspase-1 [Seminavis robusta]|uniref:Metacaspase-1 n=1 Tax=Seminavis robusta TaxID=568900 RepID=A0A9N8F145_9STRA|nr:Metacaspase-1 [Seminavis robusta]|eukprot:Sro2518_g330060.1 Metacaspase-1 (484) ;mRNA; f:2939-4390
MVNFFRGNRRNAADRNATPPDSATFLQQSQTLIPAEVRMFSGCEDDQTSADVCGSISKLPNPKGRAGGACTSALLEILHASKEEPHKMSFQQVLTQLRDKLQRQGHSQIPQLTSSRPLDLDDTPFSLIGSPTGARRALLVGINYVGQNGQLRGCHNDVLHMQDYLIHVHGFPPRDILVLMDDHGAKHHAPTREKIVRALRHLVSVSQPGDAVFFHYSGHGGYLSPDFNSFKTQQKDYDQTLIPLDHSRAGQIRDFSLFHHFVQPMKAGVIVTCLIDACHSGSVLDLPYSFRPTNTGRGSYAMQENLSMMSNLAFLYMLAGGILPHHNGLFDSVTDHLQNTVDGDLSDYQGMMGDALVQDTESAYDPTGLANASLDIAGSNDVGELEDVDIGDALGGNDWADGAAEAGGYGDVVDAEDVTRDFGGADYAADAGYGGIVESPVAYDAFGGGQDAMDGDDGCGDDGCGDEGCGDILSSLADCLNDQ